MADSIVQILPDGAGKKIQTFENTIGANLVETQAVVIVDQFGAPGTLTILAGSGSNPWGQASALTAGATATLVNIASSVAGYKIQGLIGHGTGDGYFFIQVGGVTVLSSRTRSTAPVTFIDLGNGIAVTTGSVVALKVTNESGSTADYDASLLGV